MNEHPILTLTLYGSATRDSLVLECVIGASVVEVVTETRDEQREHLEAAQQVRHPTRLQHGTRHM